MTLLNKIIEESIRQNKLQSQAAEQAYRSLMDQDKKNQISLKERPVKNINTRTQVVKLVK
jgi:hypothetical protein